MGALRLVNTELRLRISVPPFIATSTAALCGCLAIDLQPLGDFAARELYWPDVLRG